MATAQAKSVGIVGAGFTGTMLAVHLIELSRTPLEILLFDGRATFGVGTAYSTANARHLLNVRVANMSAYEADPDHFVRWLNKGEDGDLLAPKLRKRFVSRGTYGQYLQATLAEARARTGCLSVITEVGAEVTGLRAGASSVGLTSSDGRQFEVDRVALCIGNLPPALPIDARAMPSDLGRYVANPWAARALDRIGPDEPVILVGTGLTMVDVVLELRARGHRAALTALSRRGFLPVPHLETEPYAAFLAADRLPTRVSQLLRVVRWEVDAAAQRGIGWRSVIDALRPQTQALWRNLPPHEKRRFLRHVRPYWEVHRHRVATTVAGELSELLQSGQLSVVAGRILSVAADGDGLRLAVRRRTLQDALELRGSWLINCSGPQLDYGRIDDPSIRSLFDAGLARPDPLLLGLDVADDYRLLGKDGTPADALFALGPPIRGSLWECTAVPDIRKQCEALARQLTATAGAGEYFSRSGAPA